MKRLMRLWPEKLKYRLFTAFLLLILIPFSLLQIHSYRSTEQLITRSVSVQMSEQLQLVKQSMEKLMSGVFLTLLQLERNDLLQQVLRFPEQVDEIERRSLVEQLVARQEMNTGGTQMHVHYLFADTFGNLYSSLPEGEYSYDALMNHSVYSTLNKDRTYAWVKEEPNDLPIEISRSSRLLSLYNVVIDENGEVYGYYRFIIDSEAWLRQLGRELLIHLKYTILNEEAEILARTGNDALLSQGLRRTLTESEHTGAYTLGVHRQQLIGAIHLPQLGWTVVSQFPMAVYFGDLEAQRNQVLISYVILTSIFIGMTFFIASTVTRPIYLLQHKLQGLVPSNLKLTLPESAFRGEMQFLARSFNEMVLDIQQLVQQLKVEERQKEAIRFQMLLSQMNPHFLLNTLNVIKWNVMGKQDDETAKICIALAKLLETSLNVDKELIHLKHELDLAKAYVHIQNFRFENRHLVSYEVSEQLDYALVPKLCLQPLIENAYQHGLYNMRSGGVVLVRIRQLDNELVLEVRNNGEPYSAAASVLDGERQDTLGWKKRPSIGLANIRERLSLLFREHGRLTITTGEDGKGTTVQIVIPMLLSMPFEGGSEANVEGTGC